MSEILLEKPTTTPVKLNKWSVVLSIVKVLAVLFFFLVSLELMSGGFKLLGKDTAKYIISITTNPFISLFIGLLATAIIQSSSTTTSMIVAIVAAGTLTLENAIPMIMGANIGTSVTSTIVSLGHITRKDEYSRAVSAATVHDFFNIIVVSVLFPLNYFTGAIENMAHLIAGGFISVGSESSGSFFSILGATTKPTAHFVMDLFSKNGLLVIAVALVLLFISLRSFTVIMRQILDGHLKEKVETAVFGNPFKSVLWGSMITAGVQSSSVTTSLTVPLVATDKISLQKAFPFLLGANIGTTITALIASIGKSEAAISIALCHFLFNLLGVLLVMGIPMFRRLPVWLATQLGLKTLKYRVVGLAYVVTVFFLIPFALIYFTS
ncbi:Na/Pi symporter [Rapidithrix thailandica]|uniref:Na/Pi symporter n=1 Tax=Rapidithrix thailandica TaxID=413964 RepID=A0AAW9SH37_9BACT